MDVIITYFKNHNFNLDDILDLKDVNISKNYDKYAIHFDRERS